MNENRKNYRKWRTSLGFLVGIVIILGMFQLQVQPVSAQDPVTDTPEPSFTPTPSATNTLPPPPTDTPVPFGRPLVVLDSYHGSGKSITSGKTFNVTINLSNHGAVQASNVVITFSSGDFVPRGTGGVQAVGVLNAGQSTSISQQLTATDAVNGKTVAYITASISYTDTTGDTFSTDTSLAFNITAGTATSEYGGSYYASATPTTSKRPQLVISSYKTDMDPLQPGLMFALEMTIGNVGSSTAKNVTMVMGGGSASSGGTESGTAVPGGVSGAGGEFTNFAPIGSSNIQVLGNVAIGETKQAVQKLIVNVSTNPGTFPVKFSFIYTDDNGKSWQDDQVITLLVYRLPILDVNFYRTPDMFTAGMPGVLPIQVVNLSRSSTVLGSMKVTTSFGELTNDTMLIGALDAGGYFPLDVNFTPNAEGKAEIIVTIQYTDDFSQPRQMESKFYVDVAPVLDMGGTPGPDGISGGGGGGGGGGPVDMQPETFWQKVVRFFKGLFGLDSGNPQPVDANPTENPVPQVKPGPMKGG